MARSPLQEVPDGDPAAVPLGLEGLDLARVIEDALGQVRRVRTGLRHGPHQGQRDKVRTQLRKLRSVLEALQEGALRGRLTSDVALTSPLEVVLDALHHAQHHHLRKRDLRKLRKVVRRGRKALMVCLETAEGSAA